MSQDLDVSFAAFEKHYRTQEQIHPNNGQINMKSILENLDGEIAKGEQVQGKNNEPDSIERLEKIRKSNENAGIPARLITKKAKTKIAFRGFNDSNLLLPGDLDELDAASLPIEQLFSKVRVTKLRDDRNKSLSLL